MSHVGDRDSLGTQLRELRDAAQLRGVDLAALLGITQGQLSKIENGKRRIGPDQVRSWGEHTQADAETVERLVDQASRADTEVTAWEAHFGEGWDRYQQSYGEIERAAVEIRAFQASGVHGLFQLPAYNEYLQRNVVGQTDEKKIAAGLAALRNRQQLLYEPHTRLNVILAEHVLRQRFAGAVVMVEQLHRIAQLASLPTVDLAVMPTADMPTPYMASFDLFTMPADETDVVIIESDTDEIRKTAPEPVAYYAGRHQALRAQALTGQDAIDLVLRIADEVTASIFPGRTGPQ